MANHESLGRVARAVAVLWLSGASVSYAQHLNSHELQITSPAANTVVNPGQTVQIVVTPSEGVRLRHVAIVSEKLSASSAPVSRPPFVFSFTPPGGRFGGYMLTAWATNEERRTVVSTPVSIDIEPAASPTAIRALISQLNFRSQGQTVALRILATLPDGSVADATESSNMTYASANTSFATVDSNGLVTAVAPGTTTIAVTYGGSSNLKISIPVSVQLGGIGIAPTAIVFPTQQVGSASAPQKVTINSQANRPMTIRSVKASGDFTESDNCVSVTPLAAGSSCTATVTFTPSTVGSRTGTLMVADSFDGISPSITLTGTGVPVPSFALSVAPAKEKVSRGHPATYELTLTPIGGFNETVNLTCTGEPRETKCSISPASVTLNGSNPSLASVTVKLDRHDRFDKSTDDRDDDHSEQNEHRKFMLTLQGTAGSLAQSTQTELIVEENAHHRED